MTKTYLWTLSLGPDENGNTQLAYLELPKRNLTEKEWKTLLYSLDMFEPGLVIHPQLADVIEAEFVEER